MSSVQSSRGSCARKHRRPSAKKSLKFDDDEHSCRIYETPRASQLASGPNDNKKSTEGLPEPLEYFWARPPTPPMATDDSETTVNRRSLRLRTKSQFAFSQIADRQSPRLVLNPTSDDVLWRKNPDGRVPNNFSDYGTSSDCSALYFQPAYHGSCSSSMVNTKLCYDTVVRKKSGHNKLQNITDAASHSLGYSSDIDEVMSNLSIEEALSLTSELRRWDSDEEFMDENSQGNDPYLTLNDLKISNLKASLKIHQDVRVLIPLQGYEIPHRTKCAGRRSVKYNDHSHRGNTQKALRYDLRKRADCPQLENIIQIESFDINIEEYFLKAGMRIFQVSPIISIQPHDVKFNYLCPAIVQIPLNLDPSLGDEVHCLYSRSPVEDLTTDYSNISWSSEMAGKCSMNDGKVNFETFQFGIFVLVLRPKCPYSSSTKNIRARVGGKLLVSEFPSVEVCFPKEVSDLDIVQANAKIYFDTEESVSEFVAHTLPGQRIDDNGNRPASNCLATPIIQLEPHGMIFESEPVMITLPVPDYEEIIRRHGSRAKLSIWQSNTHCNQRSYWQRLDVECKISQVRSHGETVTVVTFPVSHFSFFKGVWEAISEYLYDAKIGMFYYFVSFAMKCQANMQEYADQVTPTTSSKTSQTEEKDPKDDEDKPSKPIKVASRFGLEVIVFQADKPWPQMSTYQYKVGQSNPKLVKPGKISVRLKSHYFEPDVQAGEEEEMVKEEPDFRGRDFEKQFICKFKPDVNIERGPFGKVLVTRQVSPRQKGQPIFEFNIQKHGNEADIEDPTAKQNLKNSEQNEEWSMVALTELASSLFVTEGDNWKIFATEIGMTKQEMRENRLKTDCHPFQKIVNHYRQRGGTPQELVDALYRCHRTLKVGGQHSGQGSNNTRSSNGSSGRGSLSSNAHASRIGSHDSDTSGTQTSQDSGLPVGRKRSHHSSFRGSGGPSEGSVHSNMNRLAKRRRLSREPGPSKVMAASEGDIDSNSSSSDDNFGALSVASEDIKRNDQTKLSQHFFWVISQSLNSDKWRALGRRLHLEESFLAEVNNNYKNNYRECAYQMLLEWKQRFPKKCTFGTLYSALQTEGMEAAAKAMSSVDNDGSSK